MSSFVFAAIAGLCALVAAHLRFVARAERMRKSRKNMQPGEKHGEVLQDVASALAYVAAAAVFFALGFLPNDEVSSFWRDVILFILGLIWLFIVFHILVLILFVRDGAIFGDDKSPEEIAAEEAKTALPCCHCGAKPARVEKQEATKPA